MNHQRPDIRQVRPGDEGLFARVAADVFDHAVDPAGIATYLATPGHVLVVAMSEGEIVGQCACIVQRYPDGRPASLYVDNVGVAPSHQRRGLATRMLDVAFDVGRRQGCAEAWLATEPGNAAARALYGARGLEPEPVVMFGCGL